MLVSVSDVAHASFSNSSGLTMLLQLSGSGAVSAVTAGPNGAHVPLSVSVAVRMLRSGSFGV